MVEKEFARTQLAVFSFLSPYFFLIQICFALSSLVVMMVGLLRTNKGLAWGKLMCSFMNTFTTALLCQVLCFSIVIMHITHDFTLFLSLGLFCGYFRRFEDNKVNIDSL